MVPSSLKWGQATGILVLACAFLWIMTLTGIDDHSMTVDSAAPEAGEEAVASILMRPPQLYMDSLHFEVQTYAIAYDESGRRLYSSAERPEQFSWSSTSNHVASVDETGSVTSETWGTAMVIATHKGGLEAATRVRIRDAVDLAWSFSTGAASIRGGVGIGADGTIYVRTYDEGGQSRLYATSPDGGVLWTLDLPPTGPSSTAIGTDGTLYIGSFSDQLAGSLTAVSSNGAVRWVVEGIEPVNSSPAVGPDGTIYVAGGQHVYAIDSQGKIQWTYGATDRAFVYSSPAVASDGTIYVGGVDDLLHAINPDGSSLWTFQAQDLIQSSPVIGADGTIYFGSEDGRFYAVRPEGTRRWSLELDRGGVASSPSIGSDGTVYVMAGSLFAIDPDGSIRWRYPVGSHGFQPTPILGADGTIYFGSFRGMAALDAQGRLLWNYGTMGRALGSPAVGFDGTIIATSFAGTVFTLVENGSTNGGYAGSPWPTARGGRANSGRAGG